MRFLPTVGVNLIAVFLLSPLSLAAQGQCGVERWAVKILADAKSSLVDTVPIPITVAELVQIARPDGDLASTSRVGPVELMTFVVRARLARVISESDSDIHLVLRDLEDDRITMVAEIPHPGCALGSAFADRFAKAREALRGVPRDGIVEVVGVGFFDYFHGQSGMARNGLELHPIVSLRVLSR